MVYGSIQELKNAINDTIRQNSAGEITAEILQERLHDIIDTLDSIGTSIAGAKEYLEADNDLTQIKIGSHKAATEGWAEQAIEDAIDAIAALDILNLLLEVDGADSGLDADKLDGQEGSYYLPKNNAVLTGSPQIDNAAGSGARHDLMSGSVLRWSAGRSSDAESGSNEGSNYAIYRYDDDGNYLGLPVKINRKTGDIQYENNLILNSSPSTDDTSSGVQYEFTAGENLAFGEVVYVKSDGKVWKADANVSSAYPAVGIVVFAASANNTCRVLLLGIVRNDDWNWTVGSPVYLSTNAGAMTHTAPTGSGDAVQRLGIATHADRIMFNPSLDVLTIA